MKQLTQESRNNVFSTSATLKQKQDSVKTRKSNARAKTKQFSFPFLQFR